MSTLALNEFKKHFEDRLQQIKLSRLHVKIWHKYVPGPETIDIWFL